MIRALYHDLMERAGYRDEWWREVQEYYRVDRKTAIELGTRGKDRRPKLPGSPTCLPVSGKTWEEIWNARPRDSEEAITAFWKEVGSWCVFRQLVRHRGADFTGVYLRMPRYGTLLEFGAGIAPVTWWMFHHRQDFSATLVDVRAEPLDFAEWRLWKRHGQKIKFNLKAYGHDEMDLISAGYFLGYDVVTCLEVLEHVPHPRKTIEQLVGLLKPGGSLLEDFYDHQGFGSPADLDSAAEERPLVYQFLRETCIFDWGRPPETRFGGGRRWWRKR